MANLEFDAEKYRNASAHQKQWGRSVLADLPLRGNERVLDLGCGEGVLTAEIAARVPQGQVLGIDSSATMIAAANRLSQSGMAFHQMDINDMDSRREFDVVFSNAALHWIHDHRKLADNVCKCLREGGWFRANFGAVGNCPAFQAVVRDAMSQPEFAGYFVGFTWPWCMPSKEQYEQWLADAGFSRFDVWYEDIDHVFASLEKLTGWIDQPSLVPFIQHTGCDVGGRFRQTVVDGMVSRTARPDGTYAEFFRRINVRAWR